MNEASWDRLTDAIDIKYGIAKHGTGEEPLEDAPHLSAQVRFIEFDREGERYRLERVTGPTIIDRKTIGSRRIGSEVRFENVYDPTEVSSRIVVRRLEAGEWTAVNLDELGVTS